jgi:hypothetical protein
MSSNFAAGRGTPRETEMVQCNSFCIGGVCIEISGSPPETGFASPLALDAFRAQVGAPDVAVRVEWLPGLPTVPTHQLFDSGCSWRLYEDGLGFRFDFYAAGLKGVPHKRLLIDSGFSRARLQMNEGARERMPYLLSPLGYPLDELLIMHRLTQERAIELHGVAIVGPDGASNLFVGHSGAGKSTTARLWTSLHDVEILSDDRIIVREDKPGEDAHQIFMYGTPWHGEAHFALPQRALLQRIFVLEHGEGNVLTLLTRSQAVAELFARSFVPFHRHEYVDSALSFLERVANSIPCYRYSFEPDERAVERILKFCD